MQAKGEKMVKIPLSDTKNWVRNEKQNRVCHIRTKHIKYLTYNLDHIA